MSLPRPSRKSLSNPSPAHRHMWNSRRKEQTMKRSWAVVAILIMIGSLGVAAAQGMASVKSRMAVRQSAVNKLKVQKLVGEDRKGFLAVLDEELSAEMKDLVAAENTGRRIIYEQVAKGTYATRAMVGIQRAKQIADRSVPGIMLQNQQGNWYEKQPAEEE